MASRSWNRVELIGNLTRDPELRFTPSGSAVCTFGLATNRTYVTEGEKREEVDFHRLVAWNKLAELCNQLLKKGTKAFISGRLQTRSWEGQDGQTRQVTEIVVEDMIVLTPKAIGDPAFVGTVPADELPTKPVAEQAEKKAEEKEEVKETKAKDKPEPAEDLPAAKQDPQTPPQEEIKDDLPF